MSEACVVCGGLTQRRPLRLERSVLAVCRACGHGRTLRAPSHFDAGAYAADEQERLVFERLYLPARRRSYERGLGQLGPAGGRRLLDVGSNYGDFLVYAEEAGWDATGFEPGAALRAQALSQVRSRVVASLELAAETGLFDAITMWDVLEHIEDPADQLARLRPLLAPGGRLVIRVPDGRALTSLRRLRWRALAPLYLTIAHPTNPEQHFHHFTPESLSRLAAAHRLRRLGLIEADPDERVAAGHNRVDTRLRAALHRLGRGIPYEFTIVLGAEGSAPR